MMLAGMLRCGSGACPVCGQNVSHTLSFNGSTFSETYACLLCGDTTYAVRAQQPLAA